MKELLKNSIDKSISYEDYRSLVTELVANGKTTGPNQSESLAEYTKLNNHRMKRLEKTVNLDEYTQRVGETIARPQTWLLLTEGWCGDAGQIVPVIDKIAKTNPNIDLKILLRDDNLELMDKFLTNGGRSIPKLIIIDTETLEVLGEWGPRPQKAQNFFQEIRNDPNRDSKLEIQNWYNEDKTVETQKELADLLNSLPENALVNY